MPTATWRGAFGPLACICFVIPLVAFLGVWYGFRALCTRIACSWILDSIFVIKRGREDNGSPHGLWIVNMLASIIKGEIKMDHVDFWVWRILLKSWKLLFFFLNNVYFDNKITIFFFLLYLDNNFFFFFWVWYFLTLLKKWRT